MHSNSLVCFSIPDFGADLSDYTKGFFLEFANAFVCQEPIPLIKDIFTKEERLKIYEMMKTEFNVDNKI